MLSSTSMLVPLLSNHIVKFWFFRALKETPRISKDTPGETKSMSPANQCYCNSKKGKAPLLYLKSRKAGCQGSSSPKQPTALAGSQPDESQTAQTCRSELTHLGLECWEAPGAALPRIISIHCSVMERFSNPHLLFTCQPLLNGQISLWIATCTTSNLHQTSPVLSTGSLFFSSTVSKLDALDNPLWTGCLKIYTNCDLEHCGLQCTAEWHQ